jgi:release factor glutamine methyltransferase
MNALIAAAEPACGAREAAAIARLVAEKRCGFTRADLALDPGEEVVANGVEAMLFDLAAARPVQYILGTADFYDLELAVGEGVLIPRPETEELVRWILSDAVAGAITPDAKMLDVGTGSGAIAVALAKNLPGAHVVAIDNSPEALRFARQNNERHGAGVEIVEADMLALALDSEIFDVIVSNPPYIPTAERTAMADNVVRHEPASALFVPDDDPLVFYRAIARFARRSLSPNGALYFEIHETLATETAELLAAEGFSEIELRRDIHDKPRMIRCRL